MDNWYFKQNVDKRSKDAGARCEDDKEKKVTSETIKERDRDKQISNDGHRLTVSSSIMLNT